MMQVKASAMMSIGYGTRRNPDRPAVYFKTLNCLHRLTAPSMKQTVNMYANFKTGAALNSFLLACCECLHLTLNIITVASKRQSVNFCVS